MKKNINFKTTRNGNFYADYCDANNWLFTILYFKQNKFTEKNYIFRYLKNYKIKYKIIKKIKETFDNIVEIETSQISQTEYNLLKLEGVKSILRLYSNKSAEQLYKKKLYKIEGSC